MTDQTKNVEKPYIWNGLYDTWQAASKTVKQSDDAFLSERWMERITQQLTDYRESYSNNNVLLPPRPCNLPWVCASVLPQSIVDFGGSSGWSYDYLVNTLNNSSITSYVIIENERVVEYMTSTNLHKAPVTYQKISEQRDHCDLLYCNSVLQYFSSNTEFLDLVESTQPKHILLDDLLAKGDKDFFSTQTYYNSSIPYRFLGMQQLISDMEEIGYELLLSTPFISPVEGVLKPLAMENFPDDFKLNYSLSAIFKRVDID